MAGVGPEFAVDGYEIEGLLHAGPSSELWRAREQSTGATVALRRLAAREGSVQDLARRFFSVLGRLDHPGLLRVRELIPRESELVVVLDHAERGSLEQLLLARETLDPGEVVTIGTAIAAALAAVHARGLVHGGVTPASIVFAADGTPLLAEPALEPGQANPEADVRALAAVCYSALTGVRLEAGQPQRPLRQVAPGVPAALAQAVEAGLRSDPAERPSMASFGAQLEVAAKRTPIGFADAPFLAFPPAGSPEPPDYDADELDEPAGERPARRPSRRRIAILALVMLTAVTVTLAGWQFVRARQADRQDAWFEVLTDLDRKKAAAWDEFDPALFTLVYAAGSEPLREEQANLRTYADRGVVRIQGLSWTISALDVESEPADQVVLLVTSRFEPYVLTYEDGWRYRVVPKDPPKRVRITLTPDTAGNGWLISKSAELS